MFLSLDSIPDDYSSFWIGIIQITSLRNGSPHRGLYFGMGISFVLLLSICTVAQAEISFVTSTDKAALSVGETLIYRMTLQGAQIQSITAFSPPDFGGNFQLVGSEESVTYQISNGNLNAVKTRNLRLRAISEGNIEIPPAEIRLGKEILKSQPLRIQISASKAAPELPETQGQNSNAPVILDVQVSKQSPYVGEQLWVDVLLHRRVSFFGNPQFEPLQIPGALTDTVPLQDQTSETMRNGQRFYTNTLQRLRVIPLSAGTLRIPTSRLGFHTSPFDRMQVVQSPVTEIRVRPLPSLPAGLTYSGVVGEFEWRVRVNENTVQQLTPIVVAFSIYGKGNLKPLTDLSVSDSHDIRLYRSKSEDSSKPLDDGSIQEEKQLEYIVVPQTAGELTLPTFSWTYFSSQKGRYITRSSPRISLQVRPASANIATTDPALSVQQDRLNHDIRYIKPLQPPSLIRQNSLQYPLWAISFALFLSGIGTWLGRRILKRNPIIERKQKAYSTASKALEGLKEHPSEKSLSQAKTILLEFLGARLGMSFLGLTHPEIKSLLRKENVNELLIVNTLDVLEKLTFAVYAPSRIDSQSKAALIGEAETLLIQLKALNP